ncbi:MAG: apolipoprotein N-acyltransferase [Acidimicrobiales bacterium]
MRIGIPLLGGALVGCSLPPVAPWPLGVVGMGLVVASLAGRGWKGRLGTGMLAALGQFSIALAWAVQFNIAGYVVLVLAESMIIALGAVLIPPRGSWRLPAAAAALTLAEWARESWPFGGLPLGSATLGQIGGPLQFTARLGGPLLVLFTLVLTGGGLVSLASSAITARRSRSDGDGGGDSGDSGGTGRLPALACLLAAAGLVVGGLLVAPVVPAPGAHRVSLAVAVVQGGGKRGLNQLQVPASDVFRAAVKESLRVRGHPQLILWPEDVVAMGMTRFAHSAAEQVLAGIAKRYRATLVAGVTQDVGATRFLNEVVALSPAGKVVATFEKVHRVPFGEYVPYRAFFSHLANLRDIPRDAIPGTGSGMIATPAGRFAVLISYEVFFAGRGRSGVSAGGQLILVPTNTSSYSADQAPAQEIAASQLQALEEGRFLVQAAPTGYSAVINPSAVVLERSRLSTPAVLQAAVPLLRGHTPYEQAGELPELMASLFLLGLGWAELAWRRHGAKALERHGAKAPA